MEETLSELESGKVTIEQIPRIQVMYDGERYFSMNNRRLWVFKELAKKGKLKLVPVQIETPKSSTQKKLGSLATSILFISLLNFVSFRLFWVF